MKHTDEDGDWVEVTHDGLISAGRWDMVWTTGTVRAAGYPSDTCVAVEGSGPSERWLVEAPRGETPEAFAARLTALAAENKRRAERAPVTHLYKIEDDDGDWIGVRPDGTIEGAGRAGQAIGLTVAQFFGFVTLGAIEVRANDPAAEVERINRIALEARAGTPAPSTTPIAPPDLKPRGVKRQWWLMPLDAWAYVLETTAIDPDPLDLPDALAAYQARPAADTAALVACAFAEQIGTYAEAADLAVQVFEHGAAKYSPDNWRNAAEDMVAFRREYLSAMCRHAFPTHGSIDLDHVLPDGTEVKGSGLPHDAHGLCTAIMILWHELRA